MSELAKYRLRLFVQAAGWNYTEAPVVFKDCCDDPYPSNNFLLMFR